MFSKGKIGQSALVLNAERILLRRGQNVFDHTHCEHGGRLRDLAPEMKPDGNSKLGN